MTRCQPTCKYPGTRTGEPPATFDTIASPIANAVEMLNAPRANRHALDCCWRERPRRRGHAGAASRSGDVTKALALAFGIVLAACTSPPPPPKIVPPQARLVPFELRRCPPGRPSPVGPPPPRTVQQLIDWTAQVHSALLFTERARTECASRLARLNDWIEVGK
jgi:hypothetical protein